MLLPAVMDVDLDSIPGLCSLNKLGTTNRQVFGVTEKGFSVSNLRLVRQAVFDRFRRVASGQIISDPLKVFIKQEPHKQKKLDEGRLRLIMSVSLVDALVDRILFMRLMLRVVNYFPETNVMIGWSPVKGGYRLLTTLFKGKTISIDKKAWDWSVPHWLLLAVRDVINSLSTDAPQWWLEAVRTRFSCLFEQPTFGFNDGTIGTQRKPGVMKSGCYLTIFINSVGQLILHEMAKFALKLGPEVEPIVVVGDDSLQSWFESFGDYVEYLTGLGFTMEVEEHEKVFEFAGFRYDNNYVPAYLQKHLFKLSHLPTTDRVTSVQILQNYQVLYYFDTSMMQLIKDMIRILDMPEAEIEPQRLRAIALG